MSVAQFRQHFGLVHPVVRQIAAKNPYYACGVGGMTKLERRYADWLEHLRIAGEIRGWWYEPLRLILAPKTTYCPDFMILHHGGALELHEVKPYNRRRHQPYFLEASRTKLKVAAAKFPIWTFKAVWLDEHSCWQEEAF
jgi:hypothetical protein